MSNLKKATALILVLMMFVLTGCGAKKTDDSTTEGETKIDKTNAVAIVNDHVFDIDTFNIFYGLYVAQYGEEFMNTEVNGVTNADSAKTFIINNNVQNMLIKDYMISQGFEIDATELTSELEQFNTALNEDETRKSYFESAGVTDAFKEEQIALSLYVKAFQEEIYKDAEAQIETLENMFATEIVEISARHILLEDEATALEVKAKLDAGEDFAELAKQVSKDPGSASNGGDLGYFSKGVMVEEFDNVAFSQAIGVISDPVQSSLGYHIIKVEDQLTINKMIENGKEESIVNAYKEEFVVQIAQEMYLVKYQSLESQATIETFPDKVTQKKSE